VAATEPAPLPSNNGNDAPGRTQLPAFLAAPQQTFRRGDSPWPSATSRSCGRVARHFLTSRRTGGRKTTW